jgi:hypothetical protein
MNHAFIRNLKIINLESPQAHSPWLAAVLASMNPGKGYRDFHNSRVIELLPTPKSSSIFNTESIIGGGPHT